MKDLTPQIREIQERYFGTCDKQWKLESSNEIVALFEKEIAEIKGDYCGIDQKKCGRIKTLEQQLAKVKEALKDIKTVAKNALVSSITTMRIIDIAKSTLTEIS